MQYLSPLDAAFLRMETPRTPMHIGALMTFRLPADAPPDFLRQLLAHMREQPFLPAPFDSRLAPGLRSRIAPAWMEALLDVDYHVRHSALPYPGGERELGMLVERLHSNPLDLTRPLWECHLIEGLDHGRFALYFKAHHCAIDGIGAMRKVTHWLSEDPQDRSGPGRPAQAAARPDDPPSGSRLGAAYRRARDNARALPELAAKLVTMSRGEHSTVHAAVSTPRTLFNVPVTQQRRLAAQLLDLARLKAVGAATGSSVNDVTLAICGGAVRRYLLEQDALPSSSLTASVPVGLQRAENQGGNAVAGFVCPLATQLDDPLQRLDQIKAVTRRGKDELLSMSPTGLQQFALMGLSPLILGQMSGTLARLPPFFNFTVSNVVLSKKPLYLRGAELEAMVPLSFLLDGYALNVTVIGYLDRVAVGFLGCRDAIPHLQRLAVYAGDALAELEQALRDGRASCVS